MRAEPRNLVRRLTPSANRFLEEAVGRAHAGGYYEIVLEHMLLMMLESDDAEPGLILRHFDQDRGRLAVRVERALEKMRTGNGGKPVFSETLFQWFEDGWLQGSLEYGDVRLRSGVLFSQLVSKVSRYTSESYPEIEAISFEQLKKALPEILGRSKEAPEVLPEGGKGAGGGASPGGAAAAGKPGAGPAADGALRRFTVSFTEKARAGKIDPIFGRHREIRQMIDILARRRKNNPIIIGEPGVGKTALVEGLALAIAQGEVPESLKQVELVGLDLGLLQAGAGVKGEFENRLKAVISEVKSSPTPIIVFIDEAHTLIGAGGAAGGSDAANLLKPELARGELRTVAATTYSEYKKYFEKDPALERRFQPVKVDEPSEDDAIGMLRGLRAVYEAAHAVTIRDEAVVAAVRLSHRYLSGRQLPDKAVDLLDTAAARVRIALAAKPESLTGGEAVLASLEREREAIRRDQTAGHPIDRTALEALEGKIDKQQTEIAALAARWEGERVAVTALLKAREAAHTADTAGDGAALKATVEKAAADVQKARTGDALVHAEVDADAVAKVLASWTGIPVGKMAGESITSALNLEGKLGERVRSQDAAVKVVAETVRIAYAGIRDPSTPIGVLLFVGPSGVGKTETALALADLLYGGERFMTTINMSEFQEKASVSRLIGSAPGYVGYGEGGVLTEAVRHRPYSVVLLDEVEKADLEVMNLFYQVFDKGSLSDGEGRVIDFKNTVIILTSNLASDICMELHEDGARPSAEEIVAAIRPALSKHFKPALLGRMTIVPFAPLSGEALRAIMDMKLGSLTSRLRTGPHRIETTVKPEVIDELVKKCTESEAGARAVAQTLRQGLMPIISRQILEKMAEGEVPRELTIGIGADGGWDVQLGAAV